MPHQAGRSRLHDITASEKVREVQLGTHAAMAAIEASVELIAPARAAGIPYARRDNSAQVLRGLLVDLFDGCWDSASSAREDPSGNSGDEETL